MLRMIWLTVFAASVSACVTLGTVESPKGELCSFSKKRMGSFCSDITTASQTPFVPVSLMDKWVTMPASTWESIQNSIDKYRAREGAGKSFLALSGVDSQIKTFQDHTKKLYKKSLEQRH